MNKLEVKPMLVEMPLKMISVESDPLLGFMRIDLGRFDSERETVISLYHLVSDFNLTVLPLEKSS